MIGVRLPILIFNFYLLRLYTGVFIILGDKNNFLSELKNLPLPTGVTGVIINAGGLHGRLLYRLNMSLLLLSYSYWYCDSYICWLQGRFSDFLLLLRDRLRDRSLLWFCRYAIRMLM